MFMLSFAFACVFVYVFFRLFGSQLRQLLVILCQIAPRSEQTPETGRDLLQQTTIRLNVRIIKNFDIVNKMKLSTLAICVFLPFR